MEQLAPDWRSIGTPTPPAAPAPRTSRSLDTIPIRLLALVVGGVATAVLLGAVATWLVLSGSGGPAIGDGATGPGPRAGLALSLLDDPGVALPAATSAPASVRVLVDVEGAVARPGLVQVPEGARVGDAIALAGGFAARVDLTAASQQLNLAEVVRDGTKVHVPAIGDAVATTTGAGVGTATTPRGDGRVDLNHATEAELDALPGVGPATIAKIVAARSETPFATADELRTRGIVGQAVWQKLEALVTVSR